MSSKEEFPQDPVAVPENASPWLKQAYESALLQAPEAAIADAKRLLTLLRRHYLQTTALSNLAKNPISFDVEWKQIGDVHIFDSDTTKAQICELGRMQGWNISVVRCRKTGRLRAMAMNRLR